MLSIIIGTILGTFVGIATGIVPGLHINMIATLLLFFSSFIIEIPLFWMCFIIAMAVSHNFFDFIPSIFLGAPEEGNSLAALPGHRFLLEGRGLEAIKLVSIGCLGGVIISLVLFPVFSILLPFLYENFKSYTRVLLFFISIHLILREKNPKKIGYAFLVWVLSGVLGLIVLKTNMLKFPLLPLLSGLFGLSLVVTSIAKKTKIPGQIEKIVVEIKRKSVLKGILKGGFSSLILGFIPALGPSQASLLSSELSKKETEKDFLISIGAVNTSDVLMSVIALFTINKARSGAVKVIKDLFLIGGYEIFILFVCALASGIISYFLIKKMSVLFCRKISKINYSKLNYIVLFLISGFAFALNSFLGLLVLLVSCLIGIIAEKAEIKKSHLMAVLVFPVLFS